MMGAVDARGRVMGRVNLIDAAVVVFVLLAIPMAFVAYRVVRVPVPIMTSVTPASLAVNGPLEVRVTGEHFRPFLRAYVSPTAVHLWVDDLHDDQRANYLIETPSAIELQLPHDLRAGSYDLYLFDEGRAVAHRASAFTITAPAVQAQGAPAGETATVDIDVRFLIDPDILPSVRVGDTDLNQPASEPPSLVAASLLSWRRASGSIETPRPVLANGATLPLTAASHEMDAVVRLGVVSREGVWGYNNTPIRAGEPFSFATSTYVIRGVITRVALTPAARAPAKR